MYFLKAIPMLALCLITESKSVSITPDALVAPSTPALYRDTHYGQVKRNLTDYYEEVPAFLTHIYNKIQVEKPEFYLFKQHIERFLNKDIVDGEVTLEFGTRSISNLNDPVYWSYSVPTISIFVGEDKSEIGDFFIGQINRMEAAKSTRSVMNGFDFAKDYRLLEWMHAVACARLGITVESYVELYEPSHFYAQFSRPFNAPLYVDPLSNEKEALNRVFQTLMPNEKLEPWTIEKVLERDALLPPQERDALLPPQL